jgi:hypothetical protein
MRRLHLIVDGLPRPGVLRGGVRRHAPSLALLLARGQALPGERGLSSAIAKAFGLGQDLPIAPHTLAMDGLTPENALWLRADPVSLQFHQDQLLPLGPDRLEVRQDEADALVAALQGHFAAEGLAFCAPHPDRWYVRLPGNETLPEADPLDAAVGRPLQHHLPRGPAAAVWRRRMNEIQMLLHDHAVNRARETAGKWPINSVWFWGGGRHLPLPPPAYSVVASHHHLARALAGAAGIDAEPPGRLDTLRAAEAAMVILELPAAGDEEAVEDALRELEVRWFRPALGWLRRRTIREMRLACTGHWNESRALTPMAAYRFWQRPRD